MNTERKQLWRGWKVTTKLEELERRVAALEARNVPVQYRGQWDDATKWSANTTKGTGDNGVIDLSSEFGMPAKIKAVDVSVRVHSATVTYTSIGPSSGSTEFPFYTDPGGHDEWVIQNGKVTCDDNGDIWVTFTGTIHFILYIKGYYV